MKQPLRVEAGSAFIRGGVSLSSYVLLSKNLDKATITSYVLRNKVRIIRTNKYNIPALQTAKLLNVKNVVEENNKKVRIQKASLSVPKVKITKLYNYPQPQFVKLLPSKTFGITKPAKVFRQGLGYAKAIKTLTTLLLNSPDLKAYQILNIPKILDLELVSGYADWYRYAKTLTTALRSEIASKDVVKDGFKTTAIPTSFVSKHIPRFPESNVGVIDPVEFYITARYINRFLAKDTFRSEFKPNKKSISLLESLHEIQTFPKFNSNLGGIEEVKVAITDKSLKMAGVGRTALVRKDIFQRQLLQALFTSDSKIDAFQIKESRLSASQLATITTRPTVKNGSIARNFLRKFTSPAFSSNVKLSNSKEKVYPIKNIRNRNILTSNFKLDTFIDLRNITNFVTNYENRPVFTRELVSNIQGSFVKPEFFKNLNLETRIRSTVFKDMKGPKKSPILTRSSFVSKVRLTKEERALAKDSAETFFKSRKRTIAASKTNFINTPVFNVSDTTKLPNRIFKGRFVQNNIKFSSALETLQNINPFFRQSSVSRLENKPTFDRKNVSLLQTSFKNRMRLTKKDVSAGRNFTETAFEKVKGKTGGPASAPIIYPAEAVMDFGRGYSTQATAGSTTSSDVLRAAHNSSNRSNIPSSAYSNNNLIISYMRLVDHPTMEQSSASVKRQGRQIGPFDEAYKHWLDWSKTQNIIGTNEFAFQNGKYYDLHVITLPYDLIQTAGSFNGIYIFGYVPKEFSFSRDDEIGYSHDRFTGAVNGMVPVGRGGYYSSSAYGLNNHEKPPGVSNYQFQYGSFEYDLSSSILTSFENFVSQNKTRLFGTTYSIFDTYFNNTTNEYTIKLISTGDSGRTDLSLNPRYIEQRAPRTINGTKIFFATQKPYYKEYDLLGPFDNNILNLNSEGSYRDIDWHHVTDPLQTTSYDKSVRHGLQETSTSVSEFLVELLNNPVGLPPQLTAAKLVVANSLGLEDTAGEFLRIEYPNIVDSTLDSRPLSGKISQTDDPTLGLINAGTDEIRPSIELAETYLAKSRAYLGRFIQNAGAAKQVVRLKPITTIKSGTGAFTFKEHLPILNKKSIGIVPNRIFKGRFIQNAGSAKSNEPEKIAKPFFTSSIRFKSGNQDYDPEIGKVEFSKRLTSVQSDNVRLPNRIFKGRFIQNAGLAKQETDILAKLRKDTISKVNNFVAKKPHIVLYSPERTTGTYGANQNKIFKGRFVQNNIGSDATVDKKQAEIVPKTVGVPKTFISKKAEISPTRNLPNRSSLNNLFFKGRFAQNNLNFSSTIDHLDIEIFPKDTMGQVSSFISTRARISRLFDKLSLSNLINIGTIIRNRTAGSSSIYRKDIKTGVPGTRVGGIRHKLIWGFQLKFEFLVSGTQSFDIPAYAVHPRNAIKMASDKALRKVFLDFKFSTMGARDLPEKLFIKTLGFLPDKASFRGARIPAYAVLPKSKNVISSLPVKIKPSISHKSGSLARMSVIDLDYILHDQFSNVSPKDNVFTGRFIPASQVRLRDGEIVFKTAESVTKSVSSLQDDIFKKINSEIVTHRTLYTSQIFKGRVVHNNLNFISDTKTTFNKRINDSLSLTAKAAKTLIRTPHKYPSRNISSTDGYLFNQNYVEGYFAEPYVGEARSFGNFRF